MASVFRIAIERTDGNKVLLRPGSPEEHNLVTDVIARASSKGIGLFKTQAQVKKALAAALAESLFAIKAEVTPVLY